MKISKFLAVAALATLTVFASCSSDSEPNPNGNGNEAALRISFQGTADTKAVDGTDQGVTLKDATIFVISKTDAVLNKFWVSNTDLAGLTTKEWKTTTDAKYVIVLGNLGSNLISTTFANVTTLAELKSVAYSLDQMILDYSVAANTKILLQGQSDDFNWTTAPESTVNPGSKVVSASVTVYPVPARLDVTVTNSMTSEGTATGTFQDFITIEGVAVLYSAKNNFVVPTTGAVRTNADQYVYAPAAGAAYVPYYYSGFDPAATAHSDDWEVLLDASSVAQNAIAPSAALGYLNKTWTGAATYPSGSGFKETFYALPGNLSNAWKDGQKVHTTIAIYGTYDKDGSGTDHQPERYFWYVHMSPNDGGANGESLRNGKWYDVKINLTGKYKNGGGGGKDPDEESIDAYIKVTINSAQWGTKIDIVKDIQ